MATIAARKPGPASLDRPRPDGRLRQLETLQAGRGIAALLVVLFHASKTIFASDRFWGVRVDGYLFEFGLHGVAFFFVLSGFIVLHAHIADIGRPSALRRYAAKRFVRVYPPYWAVLAPLIVLYTLRPGLGQSDPVAPATMLRSVLLVGWTNAATLPVAWSLFNEIAFYLVFAVLIAHRRGGVVALTLWFAACGAFLVQGDAPHYVLAPINLLFGFGMAARWCWGRIALRHARWIAAGGILAFVTLGLLYDFAGVSGEGWGIAFGVASAVAVVGAADAERQGRLRVPRPLARLGDSSYALYLVHYPVLSISARVFMAVPMLRALPPLVAFVLLIATCIVAGIVFHRLFEEPLRCRAGRLLDRRGDGRAPAGVVRPA